MKDVKVPFKAHGAFWAPKDAHVPFIPPEVLFTYACLENSMNQTAKQERVIIGKAKPIFIL